MRVFELLLMQPLFGGCVESIFGNNSSHVTLLLLFISKSRITFDSGRGAFCALNNPRRHFRSSPLNTNAITILASWPPLRLLNYASLMELAHPFVYSFVLRVAFIA
jgi:hypothetical protein